MFENVFHPGARIGVGIFWLLGVGGFFVETGPAASHLAVLWRTYAAFDISAVRRQAHHGLEFSGPVRFLFGECVSR